MSLHCPLSAKRPCTVHLARLGPYHPFCHILRAATGSSDRDNLVRCLLEHQTTQPFVPLPLLPRPPRLLPHQRRRPAPMDPPPLRLLAPIPHQPLAPLPHRLCPRSRRVRPF